MLDGLLSVSGPAVEMAWKQAFVAYLEAGGTEGSSEGVSSETRGIFVTIVLWWCCVMKCGVKLLV